MKHKQVPQTQESFWDGWLFYSYKFDYLDYGPYLDQNSSNILQNYQLTFGSPQEP